MLKGYKGTQRGRAGSLPRSHQVQVVCALRDEDRHQGVGDVVQHAATAPGVQQAVGEDDVAGRLNAPPAPPACDGRACGSSGSGSGRGTIWDVLQR